MIADILIGLLGLFIMIFAHELGHLLAAKLLKVKVETFSLGYGRKLWGFRWRGTTYQIAVFPFGGFTKFKGEHLFAKAIEENLDRIPEDPDSFYNQPAWKRVIISFAGPLANVVFAVLFFTLIYWVGFNEYSYGNRIILQSDLDKISAAAPAETYPADAAGLRSGDRITNINGKDIRRFSDIPAALAGVQNRTIKLTVARDDGRVAVLTITPALNRETGVGRIGVSFDAESVIRSLDDVAAQKNQWLTAGDRIVAAGDRPVRSRLDLVIAFREKPVFLPLTVQRGETRLNGIFYPDYANGDLPLGLAFEPQAFRTPPYSLWEASGRGVENVGQTIYSIGLFFTLITKIDVGKSVSGPIRTTYYIGQAAVEGFKRSFGQGLVQFIIILCYLSVILAVMNLLPLGIMDGGFIVLYAIEAIRRKPYRPRFLYIFQIVGFVIMVGLGLVVILNDFMQRW